MITGVHETYSWLETDHDLQGLLRLCPEAVLNRYLAITAVDSGSFAPSEGDKANGWNESGGIAYSPSIGSLQALPSNCCCRHCYGFDEWYIFDRPPDPFGKICHANVFTTAIVPGNVFAFINFGGFSLSNPEMSAIADLFWRQIHWMQPSAYLADGQHHLIFATHNDDLFAAVKRTLHFAENDPAQNQI